VRGSDEERAAFKRSEHEAMRRIVAGDLICPDPSAHEAEAASGTPAPTRSQTFHQGDPYTVPGQGAEAASGTLDVERLARASHARCIAQWGEDRKADPDRMLTQHEWDAHVPAARKDAAAYARHHAQADRKEQA
jgi:hypothetical protein